MLNHHHDFHDNSRQNKINNILLYHNTTIMSESTIDYTPLSILVRMGLCRDKTCQGFKSYGPVGCKCPGNNKYSTRKSSHEFMKYILFNITSHYSFCISVTLIYYQNAILVSQPVIIISVDIIIE